MNIKFFLHRIKDIILNPAKTWEAIYSENRPVKDTRNSFLLPLIILVAVTACIGSFIFTHSQLSFIYSVFIGIKYFALLWFVIFISAIIFKEITHALDLGKSFTVSFKLIAYSMAPFLLCLVVSLLFESLFFINILAFYGLYIFYIGADKMLNPPEHKKIPMLISVSVIVIVLFIVTSWVLTQLIDRIYFAFLA
ncbi:MAG: YIP1 family protein [Bacteroidales bacterium]|nr:YIP1 family protein [Bacteroidales bacterium]